MLKDEDQEDLITAYKYLMGRCKNDAARLFSVVPSERMRDETGSSERLWSLFLGIFKIQ